MAATDFIAAIELGSAKITGIAGKKNADGSIQVLAYASDLPIVSKREQSTTWIKQLNALPQSSVNWKRCYMHPSKKYTWASEDSL